MFNLCSSTRPAVTESSLQVLLFRRIPWELMLSKHGLLLLLVGVSSFAAAAEGQNYPNKPLRLIAPFAPGGSTDVVARVIAQKLSEAWGNQVVVDNRSGAGGVIGTEMCAKALPDGYTLCMGTTSTLAVNPNVYRKLPYDPARDFVLVSMVAVGPLTRAAAPRRRTRPQKPAFQRAAHPGPGRLEQRQKHFAAAGRYLAASHRTHTFFGAQ